MIKFMGPLWFEKMTSWETCIPTQAPSDIYNNTMLQLNSNITSNTIAVIPDVTGSYTGSIYLGFTYDLTKKQSYSTSSIVTNNNYLIINLTGSQVPTASGLYTIDFITGSFTIATTRAYVSGTNEVPLIQYLNPTQIEVYNG